MGIKLSSYLKEAFSMFINYQYFQLLSFNAWGGKKKYKNWKKKKVEKNLLFLEMSSFFVKLVLQNSTEYNVKAVNND